MAHKAVEKQQRNKSKKLLRIQGKGGVKKKKKTRLNGFLPPIRMIMPPVMAIRDLRVLSSPPQLVHFIPMQATPRPAIDTMILTIMRARVAWRAAGVRGKKNQLLLLLSNIKD